MKKGTKRMLGGLAFAAGAVGAAGTFLVKKKRMGSKAQRAADNPASVWARPGMTVTFRAELMPVDPRQKKAQPAESGVVADPVRIRAETQFS